MPKSVHITTPRPTLEEMEKSLGITKARKKALQPILDKLMAKLSLQDQATSGPVESETRRKRASAA